MTFEFVQNCCNSKGKDFFSKCAKWANVLAFPLNGVKTSLFYLPPAFCRTASPYVSKKVKLFGANPIHSQAQPSSFATSQEKRREGAKLIIVENNSYSAILLSYKFVRERRLQCKWSIYFANKRHKGPHIVHLSTMCHLFTDRPGPQFLFYLSAWKTQTW